LTKKSQEGSGKFLKPYPSS